MEAENTPPALRDLADAIDACAAKVAIVGLGYVGLPLVKTFVDAGYVTIGFDTDPSKINRLRAGKSYIEHIAKEWIGTWIASGTFEPTSDMARLREADVILICVPTPLSSDRTPDLRYVEQTAQTIAATLHPGQLVVLESTTYPSTTRDVVLPILQQSGLTAGEDFLLAYSPEREDPGNADFSTRRIPKVVGGIDEISGELAKSLYSKVVDDVVPVSSVEVAEACKILENTYRAVNIAMVNELKVLFDRMGINIWEVVAAAKTKPFGFQAFYPGPGLGGHCIPIDPFYLSWLARKEGLNTRFIELAGEVNAAMPQYVMSRISGALNDDGKSLRGSRILILGVAYKRDVDDPRESPAFPIMESLITSGAVVSYNDPHIPTLPSMRHYDVPDLSSVALTPESLQAQDCVVIITDHSTYDWQMIANHTHLVVDTRNSMAHVSPAKARIVRA